MRTRQRSTTLGGRGAVLLVTVAAATAGLLLETAAAVAAHPVERAVPASPEAAGPTISGPTISGPTISGPITGGLGQVVLRSTSFDLRGVGYEQSEFFLSGNATSYVPASALGSDGRWEVTPASTAPYTSRIVVNRPANPARFNGTVVVEWLNVTGGLDLAPEWIVTHNELIRDGFAWVGVSAQAVGVAATETADPVRYAALSHPGDSYSYDIFSQAGQAVRGSAATVLGGLRPRKLVAEGESQSAFRLTTYINAVQPILHVYDGFLVHSRGGGGFLAPLSQPPQADVPTPDVILFRPDLGVPVLTAQTESDLVLLGSLAARQPDSRYLRLWEIAGTAHADDYLANVGASDNGDGTTALRELNAMLDPPTGTSSFSCAAPINTGQTHYVLNAAQQALNRWVTSGVPPASAPRLEVTTTDSGAAFVLDANGNATGGIRTPAVDAPVATLSGLGQSGSQFCFLFGTTTPFDATKLAALYPSHAQFVRKWGVATAAGVAAGFIRPADGPELVAAAVNSDVGD